MSKPLSSLGEFGLIRHLTSDITYKRKSTSTGIGDDAAILTNEDSLSVVVSTEILMEGINFDLTYTPLQHLGYKAVVTGLSDIYAMNAIPQQLLISLAVSSKFSIESMEQFYQGLKLACDHYQVDLVGGDTNTSLTGLAVSITSIGNVQKEKITYRNTACCGDLICVSGNLGAAYMGLQVLEREKKMFADDPASQPQLDKYAYVVGRLLKPEARKDIIDYFDSVNILPTSMIDVSDGLSSDLLHLTTASATGCKIFPHKIPICQETIDIAGEFYLEPLIPALNGGEDYELLFTISTDDYNKIILNEDISIIGHMVEQEEGCHLIVDGTKVKLEAQGW